MITIIVSCILVCILFAPIGCLLLWQKRAYFSDGLAHSCLLATSVSGFFDIPIIIAAPTIAILFAALLFIIKSKLDNNASISVVSNTMLAIGLLLANSPSNKGISLNTLLMGDILSVTSSDIASLLCLTLVVGILLYIKLDDIVLLSLNIDLAKIHNVHPKIIETIMIILVAFILSFCMRIIGGLLVTALLIIPASTALLISKTPVQMIILSSVISLLSCLFGILISFYYDVGTVPMIIVSAGIVHFIITIYTNKRMHR